MNRMKKKYGKGFWEERLTSQVVAAILFGSLCYSGTALAETSIDAAKASANDLGETVVTAERIPSKKMDTPANITVITAKEIEANHYQDVTEALQHVNGVVVTRQGSGTEDIVRLNGDERVVVMIDGQRLNNDQGVGIGRSTVDLKMLPTLKNIERIEVVKGGGSALYGSDAVGGAINIITKKIKSNRTTLDMNTGSWGTHNYELTNEGYDANGLSWMITGGLQKRGDFGYKMNGKTDTMPSSDYNNNSLSVRLNQKLDDRSSLGLCVRHRTIQSNQFQYKKSTGEFTAYSSPQNELFNDWSANYNFKENTKTPGYLRYFDQYKSSYFVSPFNTRTVGIDYQNGWTLNPNNLLIAGLEWHESESSNADTSAGNYSDKKITNKAAYLQDTMQLSNKWSFVPGVRVDKNSKFGTYTTPKAALNYKANTNTQFYVSWGRVFKAPTADDLYYNQNGSDSYGDVWYTRGNANLRPETGYTETFGINHQLDAKTSIHASLFQSEIHDAIYWLTTYSSDYMTTYTDAVNVALEKRHGFEINFKKTVNPVWSYDLGYSYIHTEADYKSSLAVSGRNSQPNGYRLGIHYVKGPWKSNILGTFGSGLDTYYYPRSSYAVFDFNLSYDMNKQTTVYFKVNNLTNQEYSEAPSGRSSWATYYYPAPGRFFQAGITYSF